MTPASLPMPGDPSLHTWLRHFVRQSLLLLLLSGLVLPAVADESPPAPALISLDWSMTATLLALGVTPLGVADPAGYARWVGTPTLPSTVRDVGLRNQPNLELLDRLDPDGIVTVSFLGGDSRLSRIAPLHLFDIYTRERQPYAHARQVTRQLGALTHRQKAAEQLIARIERQFDHTRRAEFDHHTPLLVMQFIDDRHVRIYGDGSLFQAVFDQTGLTNGWQAPVNNWGFRQVGLDSLAKLPERTRLLVVRPIPPNVADQLDDNILWQHLPPVRRHQVYWLDPVWSFGGLPAMARFTDELNRALGQPADARSGDQP